MVTVSSSRIEVLTREALEAMPKVARASLLADLDIARKLAHVTHQRIADRCKVTRPFIVNLFALRSWSVEVVLEIQKMLLAAQRRQARKAVAL